jgi:CRP/FNR family cyclic AMP-dependent transcriptional regulator
MAHAPGIVHAPAHAGGSSWRQDQAVQVLEVEPDLAEPMPAEEREQARRAAVAATMELAPGSASAFLPPLPPGGFGFLVLEGVLACGLRLGPRLTLELLGSADLIRPGMGRTAAGEELMRVEFTAVTPARLAVLDAVFARRVARWPEVASGVVARSILRVRRLHFETAVRALPRIDERILLMLWHYAERWGRMTSDGVVLDLPLTHEQLSAIVGAQRPTVTTQLGQLERSGAVQREGRSRWVLRGDPPEELGALYEQAGLVREATVADAEQG